MTSTLSSGAAGFDPFSDDYFNDPYDTYRRLRDEVPVYHNDTYGFWALSRYEDVSRAHRDWQTFSSTHGSTLDMMSAPPEFWEERRLIISMDPPEHDRLRSLVSRVFTPRAVQSLEPMVREVVAAFVQQIAGEASFDAVADFAAPFPVEIISRMLGVPEDDRQQIRHWLDLGLHREPGEMGPSPEGIAAQEEATAYWQALVAEKRARRADDMISQLIDAEVDRGDGQGSTQLTDFEITGFLGLLGGAGAETVTKLVGNAFVLFARNPVQYQQVKDNPGMIPSAVEEILRILPPSQYQGRFTMQESEFHGVVIPADVPMLLLTGAAMRDERMFPDPDRFDVGRPIAQNLGFGIGIHSCLGAALARIESRVAIEEMIRRWPDYEIDESGLERVNMANVAGYQNVPVHVGG
jgi:cytochrome P450